MQLEASGVIVILSCIYKIKCIFIAEPAIQCWTTTGFLERGFCCLDQVGLKRENEYIPIFEYILSFKDSSSYLEIGKSMQKIKL